MSMSIFSRHYITVGGRAVHYRVGGQGPLVLMLHQSPQSSADFIELMARWSDRYTMIVPDRPGCGCSDVLPIVAPRFEDYADAAVAFMDALGLRRVALYGFHTGASEALAIADRYPERVSAVAANGVVSLTDEELADIDAAVRAGLGWQPSCVAVVENSRADDFLSLASAYRSGADEI
jgi:pimeloyl-ACP methyl ester carboxylesterase